MGIYKKYILKDIIKNYIITKKVNDNKNKIIIIHNIHLLNINDQFILRKIIEEYIVNCRFILLSNTVNNILDPIKSRCLLIKTPGFNKNIVKKKMERIINIEQIQINNKVKKYILTKSNTNLKTMLIELNTYVNISKIENRNIEYLEMKSQNIDNIMLDFINHIRKMDYEKVDEILYKLIINYKIKCPDIIKNIYNLLTNINDNQKEQIIDLNYEYNKYLINSSKKIIYLQSYINNLHTILQN